MSVLPRLNCRIYSSLLRKITNRSWIYYRRIQKCSDSPIKFSASKAAEWKAEYTRRGTPQDDSPWFQPYVVCASVAIFLLYFCVFREENDLDETLATSLYDRIEGLEQTQLKTTLQFNLEKGLSTENIKLRLQQLEEEEQSSLQNE